MDLKRLNVVLRFLKRQKVGIMYGKVEAPYRLSGYTDAAFKAQEDESSGLAIRGLAVVLTTQSEKIPTSPSGKVNLVEYLVRRIRRVVRSTFAAELNSLLDSIESVLLIQLAMHQIFCGTDQSAEELMHALESGGLYPPIEFVIDAQSVYDALNVLDVCTPQESSLKLHLIAIRNRMERGVINAVWWCDTRDMLADALTKGGIDRAQIVKCMNTGRLEVIHTPKRCTRR